MNLKVKEQSTLSDFLLYALSGTSRTSVKQLLRNGQVSVNGQIQTRHDHPLTPGMLVEVNKRVPRQVFPDNLIEIIYEDDYLIVINKKEGLLCVSSRDDVQQITAHALLNYYVQENKEYIKNNEFAQQARIFIVHRLDRETSGLLVFAKDPHTKTLLQENWEELVADRKYMAVVEGKFKKTEGSIVSWLTENRALVTYSSPVDNGGKRAVTHYKVVKSDDDFSLVELSLETGRKNQIRVHMKELGHPVAGDTKYGGEKNNRLYLHAWKLSFQHPITQKQMEFTSEAPFDL